MYRRQRYGLVLLAGLMLGACGHDDHVHLLNGFDFPVKLTITLDEGGTKEIEVPAKGRVMSGIKGKGSVKVETLEGALVAENKAYFGKADSDKKPCQRAFNVQGAAAVAQEDLDYGTGFGVKDYFLKAGWVSEDFCTATYIFEDPPEAISVDAMGPAGRTLGWVHYIDDGGWVAATHALLDDDSRHASQSRGRAQRIVKTVVAHDPENPGLGAIEKRFAEMKLVFPKRE